MSTKSTDIQPSPKTREKLQHFCYICNLQVSKRCELLEHCICHFDDAYTCDQCKKLFDDLTLFQKHCVWHSKRSHGCIVCGKLFESKSHLKKHYLTHTGERPHTCEVCSKGFSLKSDLKKHILNHIFIPVTSLRHYRHVKKAP